MMTDELKYAADKKIIAAIKNGDQQVFTKLYTRCRSPFYGYIRTNFHKSNDYVADLFQDSCLALWKNIQDERLTPEKLKCTLVTYLNYIGKYTLISRDRRIKELLSDKTRSIFNSIDDEEALRDEIERDEVIQATVNNMGEPCSSLLDKFYWEKLSCEEIAERMNYKNSDTVKTQKYKCMQKLKVSLTKEFEDHNLL